MGCTFHLSGHCQTLFLGDGASAPTPVACEISAATRRHQHRTLGVLTAAVPVWGGGHRESFSAFSPVFSKGHSPGIRSRHQCLYQPLRLVANNRTNSGESKWKSIYGRS